MCNHVKYGFVSHGDRFKTAFEYVLSKSVYEIKPFCMWLDMKRLREFGYKMPCERGISAAVYHLSGLGRH